MTGERDRGFALVTALWAALILALLLSYIVIATRADSRIARNASTLARQQAAAAGLIELAELRLIGRTADAVTVDGTPMIIRYAGYDCNVVIQDQAGLIDLNFAEDQTLFRLLMIVGGVESTAAHTLTDHILDWRESGAGGRLNEAKASDYAAANYLFGPRRGYFESVEELRLVLGMTSELFNRIAPALTVYSQKRVVNTAFAPKIVLRTLPEMTEELVDEAIHERERKSANDVPSPIQVLDFGGHVVSITAILQRFGEHSAVRKVVVRLVGTGASPIWTYSVVPFG